GAEEGQMTRLARSALLLLVFCWLLSVATAYAECAWVLWFEDSNVVGWKIVGAFPTSSACDAQLGKQLSRLMGLAGAHGKTRTTVEVDGNTVTMKLYGTVDGPEEQLDKTVTGNLCRPDTV